MTIQNNLSTAVKAALEIKKLVIFFVSNKGGVGKSEVTAAVATILRSMHFNVPGQAMPTVAVFSADPQNLGIQNYLGAFSSDATKTVTLINIDTNEGRDDLLNILDNPVVAAADVILIDLKANSVKVLEEVLGDATSLFMSFNEAGFDVIVACPLSSEIDSAYSIQECVETYGDLPTYVTVINEFTVDKSDSKSIYHKEYKSVALKALEGHKHIEVTMPALETSFVELCKANHVGPFSDDVEKPNFLSRAQKIRWNIARQKVSDMVKTITGSVDKS